MIVFDLKCPAGHQFEAWFGSSEDYEGQRARGLVACPICGDAQVEKAVMAPAVSPKSNQRPSPMPQGEVSVSNMPDLAKAKELLAKLAHAQSEALKESQWVGRQFADMARAMHYGEEEHSRIHGEVAPAEARELIEEGVEVAALIFPVVPPEAQH